MVSVNKYLRNFTHTPFDGAGEMGEEGEVEEANDTEVDWGRGGAVYKRNKYIASERECRHNLSLEYGSDPDWPCETGGLEDLEREGRVNCGLCCCCGCCDPEPEGPSREDSVVDAEWGEP